MIYYYRTGTGVSLLILRLMRVYLDGPAMVYSSEATRTYAK